MKNDVTDRERESYKDSKPCCGPGEICGSGHDWNDTFQRRAFLKGLGGATAGTVLALNGMRIEVLAQGPYSAPLPPFYIRAAGPKYPPTVRTATLDSFTQIIPDPQDPNGPGTSFPARFRRIIIVEGTDIRCSDASAAKRVGWDPESATNTITVLATVILEFQDSGVWKPPTALINPYDQPTHFTENDVAQFVSDYEAIQGNADVAGSVSSSFSAVQTINADGTVASTVLSAASWGSVDNGDDGLITIDFDDISVGNSGIVRITVDGSGPGNAGEVEIELVVAFDIERKSGDPNTCP